MIIDHTIFFHQSFKLYLNQTFAAILADWRVECRGGIGGKDSKRTTTVCEQQFWTSTIRLLCLLSLSNHLRSFSGGMSILLKLGPEHTWKEAFLSKSRENQKRSFCFPFSSNVIKQRANREPFDRLIIQNSKWSDGSRLNLCYTHMYSRKFLRQHPLSLKLQLSSSYRR